MTSFPARLSMGLLVLAAAAGSAAWRLQSEAATALERAVSVQERRIPQVGGAPTSLEEYRDVIRALQESIALRGRIDGLLTRVEGMLGTLGDRQDDAGTVADAARGELEEIARTLGGAEQAAGVSVDRLGELGGRLDETAGLARLIAEELEELDRSLGPSAGGSP